MYVTRVWCVFEQLKVAQMKIAMEFTLPAEPAATLIEYIEKGKDGIQYIKSEITKIDSASSQASVEADEKKVKEMIINSVGFAHVDHQVAQALTTWIGKQMQRHMDSMLDDAPSAQACPEAIVLTGAEAVGEGLDEEDFRVPDERRSAEITEIAEIIPSPVSEGLDEEEILLSLEACEADTDELALRQQRQQEAVSVNQCSILECSPPCSSSSVEKRTGGFFPRDSRGKILRKS